MPYLYTRPLSHESRPLSAEIRPHLYTRPLSDEIRPLSAEIMPHLYTSPLSHEIRPFSDAITDNRYAYERIDGSIGGDLRQQAIDRFSRPDSDR
jgi:hypothetical protein